MEIYVNIMKSGEQTIIAACDAELLDKTLSYGNIKFKVRKDFYEGSLVYLEEAVELIRKGNIINLVGEMIVKGALRHGLVHPNAIIDISGVPHAQVIRL